MKANDVNGTIHNDKTTFEFFSLYTSFDMFPYSMNKSSKEQMSMLIIEHKLLVGEHRSNHMQPLLSVGEVDVLNVDNNYDIDNPCEGVVTRLEKLYLDQKVNRMWVVE